MAARADRSFRADGVAMTPETDRAAMPAPVGGLVLLGLLCGTLAAPACSRQPKKDVFVEHVNAKAQNAEGYSPATRPRRVAFERTTVTAKPEAPATRSPRPLPRQRVTLRMYDTELVSVVRAMARAAGANVVVSSSVPGAGEAGDKPLRINVNVTDAPWDETFKSILSSNGLAYVVEGDIIRVMTLADLDRQNRLREAQNKASQEAATARELAPYETCKVEINYADVGELATTLNALCGNTAAIPGLGEKAVTTTTTVKGVSSPNDPSQQTTISLSKPGQAPDPALPGQSRNRPGLLKGYVIPDHNSNSLIIQASRQDAEKLIALIEKLDQPRPQIKIKAFIVQTDRKTAQQLGIQWGGTLKSANFRVTPGQMGTTNNDGTTSTTPVFPGGVTGQGFGVNNPAGLSTSTSGLGAAGTAVNFLFGKIGQNALEAQLTALAEENKAKILSSPTITTMENKEAFTESGKKIPFVSSSQYGSNVQFADALLRLEILPHVIDGANLRLRIVVKDDQVDETQSNWVQGNPPIYKRETRSTLVVEDGDTVVISGLTREAVANTESGVPFLRDIPGLGWAFKSKGASLEREEILIFITPVILKEKPIAPAPPVVSRDEPPIQADFGARP